MDKKSKKYSLAIIGGGIVGLTAAIAYAKNRDTARYPVILLEKQPIVGGMVTSFKRKGYTFDTSQLIPDPLDLFKYLEIDCALKQFEGYFARIFLVKNGKTVEIRIPSGYEAFETMLTDRYPNQKKAIKKFFAYSKKMFEELQYLKLEPTIFDLIITLFRCPKIVMNASKTFSEYLDQFGFSDPELTEIFDVFAAFSGLPKERTAAMISVSSMNMSLLGTYRASKAFINFPHAMKKKAIELGCEIRTQAQVTKILIENGAVTGLQLENGDIISAEKIITTVDTKLAMENLVGLDIIDKIDKKYSEKVRSVAMSPSAMTVSLGLDDTIDLNSLGLDCGYNIITTGTGTFEKLFKAFDKGEYILDEKCFHAAVICPSLTTGGKQVIIIRIVPMPMADWKKLRDTDYDFYTKKKEEVADFYIRIVEKHLIAELSKHIVVKDIATPATFERYSGSPTGSNYDMSSYPTNFGLKRLSTRTPVHGLFQPKFSHGIWPSMQSGLQVVDMILGGEIMDGYSRYRVVKMKPELEKSPHPLAYMKCEV